MSQNKRAFSYGTRGASPRTFLRRSPLHRALQVGSVLAFSVFLFSLDTASRTATYGPGTGAVAAMMAGWSNAAAPGAQMTTSGLLPFAATPVQKHQIDAERSAITVHVYRAGLFSAFAHDHEIAASIAEGWIEFSKSPAAELRMDARQLRVLDPNLAADKRSEVRNTMEGPKVLDSSRFPEILFRTTVVEKSGSDRWVVHGILFLHGQTHPVVTEVREVEGRYRGSTTLKQGDFGIKPISIAGGTVRVKDEVRVAFEIVVAE
jgi:polyisoprenoid-binding protein YceI